MEFADWWQERETQIKAAFGGASREFPQDLNQACEMLGDHAASLGWVNAQIPEAEEFLQNALARATERLLEDGRKGNVLKVLAEAQASTEMRAARTLDRLSATLTHRIDAIRSIISKGKAELEHTHN